MTSLIRASALAAVLASVSTVALAQTAVITRETSGPYYLSPEQRTIIYRNVVRERAPVAVVRPGPSMRYEIGVPVPPGNVEFSAFPDEVYIDAPVLKRYRYVYVDNQLVLVDPETRQVIDIINE